MFDAVLDVGVCVVDEVGEGLGIRGRFRFQLDVAHELAGALQETGGIGERVAVEESDVDVGGEDVDVGEGGVSEAGDGAAVMEEFADFVAAVAHEVEPMLGDGSEGTGVVLHPGFDGGVALEGSVES